MSAASNLQAGTIVTCACVVNGRHDSLLTEWSDKDRACLVRLPEQEYRAITLETRVGSFQDLSSEWPAPHVHAVPAQPTGAEK